MLVYWFVGWAAYLEIATDLLKFLPRYLLLYRKYRLIFRAIPIILEVGLWVYSHQHGSTNKRTDIGACDILPGSLLRRVIP